LFFFFFIFPRQEDSVREDGDELPLDFFSDIYYTINTMRKTFKYRIKANKKTISKAEEILKLCRILYNLCLEQRKFVWEDYHKSISGYDQVYELPSLKKFFPQFKKVPSQTLQEVVERVNKAFQNFFRRVKQGQKPGYPRFKSFNHYHSFTLKQAGWKLTNNQLKIKKIGDFKIVLHRPIEGDIKTITIKKTLTGKWFVLFSCENVPTKELPKTGKSIGIDVGCENFLTTSDGDKISNPRWSKKSENKIKHWQKRISTREKGSNRREKAKVLLAKIHEKIFNQRKDFHFKITHKILKSYDVVCIENMNHFNSFRSLNRSMRDVAWFNFFNILVSKEEETGKQIIKVPAKNTSQICSNCSKLVPKDLSVRVHECPHCGFSIDRDINAARNILRLGASLQLSLN